MYSHKLAVLATAAFAIFAAAAPTPGATGSSGDIQCCATKSSSNQPGVTQLLGLLGVVVDAVQDVYLDCTSILDIADSQCNSNTVECKNNNFNGLVALGCQNINL